MIINKKNLAVVVAVSRKDDYYRGGIYECVHVTKHYTQATNSFMIARVSNPKIEDNDFPRVLGFEVLEIEECLIPADQAKKLSQAIIKKTTLPILQTVRIGKDEKGVKAAVTDLENSLVIEIPQTGDHYPDTDETLNRKEPSFSASFPADQLIKLLKIAALFDKDSCQKVTIEFCVGDPTLTLTTEDNEQTFIGKVMSFRD